MKTVYLYSGMSSGYLNMLRYLLLHKAALAEQGLFYGAVSPDVSYGIHSHHRLYTFANFSENINSAVQFIVQRQLQCLDEKLEAGEDVLLSFSGLHTCFVLALIKMLRDRPAFADCRFVLLLAVGRQDVWLEQWGRLNSRFIVNLPHWLAECERIMFDTDCLHLDTMTETFISELGQNNVYVLQDPTNSCAPQAPAPAFLEKFFAALGRVVPEGYSPPRGHRLSLHSRDARQYYLWCVRSGNTWPDVNLALWESLQHIEQELQLDSCTIISPKLQAKVRATAADGNKKIAERFFNRQELYPFVDSSTNSDANASWSPYGGLTDATIERISNALPEAVAAGLLERLVADAAFLGPEQQNIAASLQNTLFRKKVATLRVWKKVEPARVAVLTITYQHKKYIAENMESVLAQKTDFPVDHYIVDDYSQDGARDCIASYAAKYPSIKPYFLAQHSFAGSGIRTLFSLARNKYVSICDGDDYFCDPEKLQTQYEYLESHPSHGLCFHPVRVVFEDVPGKEHTYPPPDMLPRSVKDTYYLSQLFKANFIQTNSAMYRWRFCDGLPPWFDCTLVPGDWYWHLLHAETGPIGFINKPMSVYRRHTNALYIKARTSRTEHRLATGLQELHAYDVVLKHFGRSHEKSITSLASGVFSDFVKHFKKTGDDSIIKQAAALFPHFTSSFLDSIV